MSNFYSLAKFIKHLSSLKLELCKLDKNILNERIKALYILYLAILIKIWGITAMNKI